MKPTRTLLAALGCLCLLTTTLLAPPIPQLVNYQGRVAVGTTNFNGTGQFKFALVTGPGTTTFWSNDGTSTGGSQPAAAVSLTVTNGLYSVLLGDTSLGAAMTAIPASVWTNPNVHLRVWFNDGTTGFQLLAPDQRLAPNGYHSDGSIFSEALANAAVTSAKIQNGAVTNTQLAPNAVQAANIAAGAVGSSQIANVSIATANLANSSVTTAKLGSDVGFWSVNGADIFRSAGNVGIGTPTPAAPFTLVKNASGTVGPAFRMENNAGAGNDKARLEFYDVNIPRAALEWSIVNNHGGATWNFVDTFTGSATVGTASRLFIAHTGNVGIGNTNPGRRLHIGDSGVAGSSGIIRVAHNDGAASFRNWDFGVGDAGLFGSVDNFGFKDVTGGTILTLQSTQQGGNVGIGKTNPSTKLDVAGDVTCVAVNITSDRNAKEQFKPVNAREVLDKVARLPISEWQYKAHDDARHIGPMAQDFREAFALGRDEKHITSVDADGVALAAIQGLNEKLEEQLRDKGAELDRLKAGNQSLAERLSAIERALGLPDKAAEPAK